MSEESKEQAFAETVRKRRREIALYNRMLKTSDIRDNKKNLLIVGFWKEDAERLLVHAEKRLKEIRAENDTPKYRWSDG